MRQYKLSVETEKIQMNAYALPACTEWIRTFILK